MTTRRVIGSSGSASGSGTNLRWFDATATPYSAAGNGTTDDSTAIKAAVDAAAAAGGGVVFLPTGTYRLNSAVEWVSGVSLVGSGAGKTILKTYGSGGVSAIHHLGGTSDFIIDAHFRDFEIDGTNVTGAYHVANKGIFFTYSKRCTIRNVYVHGTGATGIGTDQMDGCVIDSCVVESCGRLNDGTQAGGNGIGIGSASTTNAEPVAVTNNTVRNNKRYGIFVEAQGSPAANTDQTRGARITGNYCSGNQVGIADSGNYGTVIASNICEANTVAGVACDNGTYGPGRPGYDALISSNQCRANLHGILLDFTETASTGRVTVIGNRCFLNTGNGIRVLLAATDVYCVDVVDNVCKSNAKSGIRFMYSGSTTAVLYASDVQDNRCYGNGTDNTVSERAGIRLETLATDVDVRGNRALDHNTVKVQDFGLVVAAASTMTGGAITDNDFRGNATSAYALSGTISATTHVARNLDAQPNDPAYLTANTQTTDYTLVLSDQAKTVEINNAGAKTVTVPPNSSVAFPVGTVVEIVRLGAGSVTVAQGAGVVLRNRIEAAGTTNRTVTDQYGAVSIRKRGTDEWVLVGDLS